MTDTTLNGSPCILPIELAWSHFDTDVDGDSSIPAGVQSWSITIVDPNGPDPVIGLDNGTRSIPSVIGVISGSTEESDSQSSHAISYVANGNRLYIVYAIKV